jgi:Tfp pilus assembly protein PilZ
MTHSSIIIKTRRILPRIRPAHSLCEIIPHIIGLGADGFNLRNNILKNSERRIHPRVNTDARCWLERESITLYGTVSNISQGGLFLCTPVTLSVGENVDLSIDLENGRVNAQGHIVWANSTARESSQTGLGIYFDKISSGITVLQKFLSKNVSRKAV